MTLETKPRVHPGSPAPATPPASVRDAEPEDGRARPSLALLAHELRTPLAAIHSLADVVAEQRFGPDDQARYRAYAASIRDAASHLLGVIETELGAGSGAASAAVRSGQAVDLNEAVRTVSALLAELAGRRGAALDSRLAEAMPLVLADRTAIVQMLVNLTSNALRHAGLEASIVLRTGRDADGAAWVEVEDDGPGLGGPSRGAGTADASGIGDGRLRLGLPLTKALARANGADLTFPKSDASGTCARLTFGRGRLLAAASPV